VKESLHLPTRESLLKRKREAAARLQQRLKQLAKDERGANIRMANMELRDMTLGKYLSSLASGMSGLACQSSIFVVSIALPCSPWLDQDKKEREKNSQASFNTAPTKESRKIHTKKTTTTRTREFISEFHQTLYFFCSINCVTSTTNVCTGQGFIISSSSRGDLGTTTCAAFFSRGYHQQGGSFRDRESRCTRHR
jgi:hypothetical protein